VRRPQILSPLTKRSSLTGASMTKKKKRFTTSAPTGRRRKRPPRHHQRATSGSGTPRSRRRRLPIRRTQRRRPLVRRQVLGPRNTPIFRVGFRREPAAETLGASTPGQRRPEVSTGSSRSAEKASVRRRPAPVRHWLLRVLPLLLA